MGWFKKLGKSLKKGFKKIGGFVKKVAKKVPLGKIARSVIGAIPVVGGIAEKGMKLIGIGEGGKSRSKKTKKTGLTPNYFAQQANVALAQSAHNLGVKTAIKQGHEPTKNPLAEQDKNTSKSNNKTLLLGGLALGGLALLGGDLDL